MRAQAERACEGAIRPFCKGPLMAKKIYSDAASALEGLLFDGMTICAGGFGCAVCPSA
jgi:hypothetical protein